MAKKSVVITVCDVCGNEATTRRTLDVCQAHSKGTTAGTRKPRAKVKCPKCGKMIGQGAGMTAHLKTHEKKKVSA